MICLLLHLVQMGPQAVVGRDMVVIVNVRILAEMVIHKAVMVARDAMIPLVATLIKMKEVVEAVDIVKLEEMLPLGLAVVMVAMGIVQL